MITRWGMGSLGLTLAPTKNSLSWGTNSPRVETSAKKLRIDQDVQRILQECYQTVKNLHRARPQLDRWCRRLHMMRPLIRELW
jgi:ATP-dependent Zn protease